LGLVLVGAGGHARALVEALGARGLALSAYVDRAECAWLPGLRRYDNDDASKDHDEDGFVLGIGAVNPDGLARRLELFRRYAARGWTAPAVVHPAAVVSVSAALGAGSHILAAAVVQPGTAIGAAAIVNTGAIVEHDSTVGEGAHVAPGAIVLGGVRVGACAMIGAGAVVLQGASVPDRALVPANTRYPG
jgi:sugar O-acyltransferase (sialic acid O-acetyltransferase NeuD family)